jgi:hypothetical protein
VPPATVIPVRVAPKSFMSRAGTPTDLTPSAPPASPLRVYVKMTRTLPLTTCVVPVTTFHAYVQVLLSNPSALIVGLCRVFVISLKELGYTVRSISVLVVVPTTMVLSVGVQMFHVLSVRGTRL